MRIAPVFSEKNNTKNYMSNNIQSKSNQHLLMLKNNISADMVSFKSRKSVLDEAIKFLKTKKIEWVEFDIGEAGKPEVFFRESTNSGVRLRHELKGKKDIFTINLWGQNGIGRDNTIKLSEDEYYRTLNEAKPFINNVVFEKITGQSQNSLVKRIASLLTSEKIKPADSSTSSFSPNMVSYFFQNIPGINKNLIIRQSELDKKPIFTLDVDLYDSGSTYHRFLITEDDSAYKNTQNLLDINNLMSDKNLVTKDLISFDTDIKNYSLKINTVDAEIANLTEKINQLKQGKEGILAEIEKTNLKKNAYLSSNGTKMDTKKAGFQKRAEAILKKMDA